MLLEGPFGTDLKTGSLSHRLFYFNKCDGTKPPLKSTSLSTSFVLEREEGLNLVR